MRNVWMRVLIYVWANKGGFAKVTGPLFSVSASGKFAQSLVYFGWKGLQIVRELVIPANPQSEDQGDIRQILGGLGRAPKYVQTGSDYEGFTKAVAPAGQTWLSYFVSYMMTTHMNDGGTFETFYTEASTHGAAGDFDTRAAALGLTALTIAYRGTEHNFPRGIQLYCLARYGADQYLLDNTKFNAAPYTKAIATWVDADIVLMVADFS